MRTVRVGADCRVVRVWIGIRMSCTRDTRHGPRWGGGVHSFFEVIVYRDITTSFYREIPHALDEPELQSRVSLRFSPYSP